MLRNSNVFGRSQLQLVIVRLCAVVHCQVPSGDGLGGFRFAT